MQQCKIKKEFLDSPSEENKIFNIVEDNGDRLMIQPVEWVHGDIIPTELVRSNMINIIKK